MFSPVDVNNDFNNKEDRIQYAIGALQVYVVIVETRNLTLSYTTPISTTGSLPPNLKVDTRSPCIIALNEADALIKFLRHSPDFAKSPYILRVEPCM